MKVSIIIPVYNVSDYIERCIGSVMAQTYTDLECIIVDDCTPDDSIVKCERLIAKYNGHIEFKIIYHERNRGLSAARNTGTDAAIGEYVYYLDSDDKITPNCISLLAKETEIHPQVELVQGNVQSIPYSTYYDLPLYKTPQYVESNEWIRYCFFSSKQNFPVNAWNKLVNRSFLIKNNLFFKEGLIHEDELWSFFVVKKLQKISIISDITYIHYATNNSIMSTVSAKRSAKHWGVILNCIIRNVSYPLEQLQLYKYLLLYITWLPFAYRSMNYWRALPFFVWALLKESKEKLAIQLVLYVTLFSFHRGECRKQQLTWSVENLWETLSGKLVPTYVVQ